MDTVPIAPDRVAFWSGAGISRDWPTGGPLGRALTDAALTRFFDTSVAGTLEWLYEALDAPNRAVRPRLETVLDVVFNRYGGPALADCVGDLRGATPNANHRFFAAHVRAGGHHVTANFDTCIERAGLGGASGGGVVHFHGSLDPTGSMADLGARMAVIQHGFPPDLASQLDGLLLGGQLDLLVFVGYSGSDFFDATPYLLDRLTRPGAPGVLWFQWRDRDGLETVADPAQFDVDLARELASRGVAVEVVAGRLPALLDALAIRMGLAPVVPVSDPRAPGRTPGPAPDTAQRDAATIALFARLGYQQGVIDRTPASGPAGAAEADALASALWGAGRYRQALAAWQQAYPSGEPADMARLVERRGAVLWIRGSLLRAERHVWAAIQRWCRPDSGADRATQAELLELYGRIAVHMGRLPDTRFWLRPARVQEARRRLAGLSAEIATDGELDLAVRVNDVQSVLGHQPRADALAGQIDTLQEAESLNSWLHYEHAQLRERAEAGDQPTRADWVRLQARFRILGATGDAARVPLLPGAGSAFPIAQVARGFRGVDITAWHRARLVGGFAARRAIGRARRSRPTR